MAFGFDQRPDFFDLAVLAEEEGAADDTHEGAAHEFFFLPGAQLSDDFVIRIAEQRKIELLLLLEGSLGFDGIGAQSQDGYV